MCRWSAPPAAPGAGNSSRDQPAKAKTRFKYYLRTSGLLAACLLLPYALIQLTIYRRNLAVNNERFPLAASFQKATGCSFSPLIATTKLLGQGA